MNPTIHNSKIFQMTSNLSQLPEQVLQLPGHGSPYLSRGVIFSQNTAEINCVDRFKRLK